MVLEHRVLPALPRYLAGLQGQEVTDEGLEMSVAGMAREPALDRLQMVLVQPLLLLAVERHEDVVTDQVGAAERAAAGIHRLENALRVVLPLLERDVDDAELAQPGAQRGNIGAEPRDQFPEQLERTRGSGVTGPSGKGLRWTSASRVSASPGLSTSR